MPLHPGSRLGRYEVVAAQAAGALNHPNVLAIFTDISLDRQ